MGYTFDTNLYSDFFKDVYGFRPRHSSFYDKCTSDDQKQVMWDDLSAAYVIEMKYQEEREKEAITAFEALIIKAITLGASNRKTAIRWLSQAIGDNDPGYICYSLGIPYSYEGEIKLAIG